MRNDVEDKIKDIVDRYTVYAEGYWKNDRAYTEEEAVQKILTLLQSERERLLERVEKEMREEFKTIMREDGNTIFNHGVGVGYNRVLNRLAELRKEENI